jgi:ketosteroid isomerase-like protein
VSQKNVERVARFYAANDQVAALMEMSAPDVVVDLTALFLDQTLIRGMNAARAYVQSSPWASLRFNPERVIAVDDERVLVLSRTTQTGRASGVTLETCGAQEFTFRDGLLVRYKVYPDRDDALKAAGLEE